MPTMEQELDNGNIGPMGPITFRALAQKCDMFEDRLARVRKVIGSHVRGMVDARDLGFVHDLLDIIDGP